MTLYILALETSSSLCGVALLAQDRGQVQVYTLEHDATGEHAERLLPMADDLLAQADIGRSQLAAVAFGQGPGGFTGLRVACGVAQGMGFALNIPVIPVVSLLAVAVRDHHPGAAPVSVVVQDARMGEVYLAAYLADGDAATGWRELQAPILLNAGHVGHWLEQSLPAWQAAHGAGLAIRLAGDALLAYPALAQLQGGPGCAVELGSPLRPDAPTVARLALIDWHTGGGIAPELAAPLYVRDKVAYTTLERQQGMGGNPKAQASAVVSIHQMAVEHLDEVAAIELSVQSFPWTRGNFADGLQAGYGGWVACEADRIVGFCMVMFAPDVAHVLVIAVAPHSQKKGIGALMLQQCEREARLRGLPAMLLEVRPSNLNALNFYKHRGFRQLAIRKDYYPAGHDQREDACVMEKRLDAT